MRERPIRIAVFALLAVLGVAARIWLISTSRGGVEITYYEMVTRAISSGEGLYGTGRNNYAPIWAGVLALGSRASEATGIPLAILIRAFLTGIDLVTAAVLWRIAVHRRTDPWKVPALFLANPASIWTTGFQGQFDGLSLMFLLVAILVTCRERGTASGWPAVIFLSLSLAAKQITAFHPILWLRRVRHPAMVLVPYAAVAALFLPFLREWRGIRDSVVLYQPVPRSYGLSEFVLFDDRFTRPVMILCIVAGIVTAWRLRREPDLVRSAVLLFLVLLLFAPGFGTQYAVWPLTVGVLLGGAGYFLLTATTMAWTLGSHFGVPGSGRWMGHLVWLSVAFWLAREVKPFARPRTAQAGA